MIELSKSNDITILHLYGEVSLMEMELIEKTITSLKSCSHTKIVLDLSEVDHMHFKVAKRLAEQAEALKKENGDLKLAQTNNDIKQTMRFVGADQSVQDYATLSEGILSFLNVPPSLDEKQSLNKQKKKPDSKNLEPALH